MEHNMSLHTAIFPPGSVRFEYTYIYLAQQPADLIEHLDIFFKKTTYIVYISSSIVYGRSINISTGYNTAVFQKYAFSARGNNNNS